MDLLQTIRGRDDYGPEPVSGIGDIHAREYPPTMARHIITMTGVALRKEKVFELGIVPENGDDALRGKTFSIEIFSKQGPLLRKWEQAVGADADLVVTAHRVLMKDATFFATDAGGILATP